MTTGAAAVEQRQAILEHLREYNSAQAGPANAEALCIALLGGDGSVEGGLFGKTLYDWLAIELLFVPERLRGSGVGTQLMAEAEELARARGCVGAWLDTFSFQARGFYEKLGYSLAGTIPGHPVDGARYFMTKRWSGPA